MAEMSKLDIILKSPQTPGWLKEAARHCLLRDPMKAMNEAELLAQAMRERAVVAFSN